MNRFLYISSCLSLFLIPIISSAQENLTTILERGYPAQWFVCGPFESDLDQGIIEAVANAQVPLGRNDFMASRGGTKNVQPYQEKRVVYKNNGPVAPGWMFAKVSANNQTFYHPFDLKTEE